MDNQSRLRKTFSRLGFLEHQLSRAFCKEGKALFGPVVEASVFTFRHPISFGGFRGPARVFVVCNRRPVLKRGEIPAGARANR
jgi:hypothetical protein